MNKSKLLPPVIWLIGMPGVGKSSIATLLRSKLKDHSINQIVIDTDTDNHFKDTDGEVLAPSDWIEKFGIDAFRKQERHIMEYIISRLRPYSECFVIATGGGLPCYEDNMDLINEIGISIWIKPTDEAFDLICAKLASDKSRPITQQSPEAIKELMNKRIPFYSKATYTITSQHKTPEDDVQQIMKLFSDQGII